MKAKEIAMVISVAVLFALFIGLLIDAVYETPHHEDICPQNYRNLARTIYEKPIMPITQITPCATIQQEQSENVTNCFEEEGYPIFEDNLTTCTAEFKYCETCDRDFKKANNAYNRNIFFIIAPIGLIAVILGLLLSFEVIGSGAMFGGIALIIYATARYFIGMGKVMRVIVIFIELVILIAISIKKLKK